jgi:hypothetical protein
LPSAAETHDAANNFVGVWIEDERNYSRRVYKFTDAGQWECYVVHHGHAIKPGCPTYAGTYFYKDPYLYTYVERNSYAEQYPYFHDPHFVNTDWAGTARIGYLEQHPHFYGTDWTGGTARVGYIAGRWKFDGDMLIDTFDRGTKRKYKVCRASADDVMDMPQLRQLMK